MPSFYTIEICFNSLHSMKNAYYVLADHIKMPLSDSPVASSRPGLENYQEPGSHWAQEFFFIFFLPCFLLIAVEFLIAEELKSAGSTSPQYLVQP